MKKLLFILSFFVSSLVIAQKNKPSGHYEWENNNTLKTFLEINNVEINVKDLATLDYFNSWAYFDNNGFIQVPNAVFFNREGYG